MNVLDTAVGTNKLQVKYNLNMYRVDVSRCGFRFQAEWLRNTALAVSTLTVLLPIDYALPQVPIVSKRVQYFIKCVITSYLLRIIHERVRKSG